MEHLAHGSASSVIDERELSEVLDDLLDKLGALKRVLLIPPDISRHHSYAGEITRLVWQKLHAAAQLRILPAIGTHTPMTAGEIKEMFGDLPKDLFIAHDWRRDLVRLGDVPSEFIHEVSEGKLDYAVRAEVNKLLTAEAWDAILSIGQLVPHEVIGIANHNKNVFVGTGGSDTINKTHFLGAVYGMERIMGRADTPVRRVLDYASDHFARNLPITYVMTVRSRDDAGRLVTRGLFAGNDAACFRRGAALAQAVNVDLLDRPLAKVVVYLDPKEFKSTWLGNKAIYRTRMALADGGELIILAPGVKQFGEDAAIDKLIRKFGYRGTEQALEDVGCSSELGANLSAAAHLIHGSSEGRFTITYCPGGLSRSEIESVGYRFGDYETMARRYDPARLVDGVNVLADGEEVFFISNPALGLWADRKKFT